TRGCGCSTVVTAPGRKPAARGPPRCLRPRTATSCRFPVGWGGSTPGPRPRRLGPACCLTPAPPSGTPAGWGRSAPRPRPPRGAGERVEGVVGHIPGAVNAPGAENVGPDGRFRPAAELTDRFAALGAAPDVEVAAYCGSGITAAHTVLALEAAGFRAALYPGSWSEWSTDPSRPVATGPNPG